MYFIKAEKNSEYIEIKELSFTKFLKNGTLLFQHVQKDREGFYMCEAKNGIGSGIAKAVHLKVLCKYNI